MDSRKNFWLVESLREFDDIIEGQPVTLINNIPGDPMGFVKGYLIRKEGNV